MHAWFKRKTRLERLKERYAQLMKKSYRTALTNKSKSDKLHRQAAKVFEEIQYYTLKYGDK
ncbi:hypothetical protein ATE92_0335 [Ulvibacter sp. MAR_2010_11]|nr:hypothetical protein ATE92_0335 [Ulvibacter sp. MAR_2010_11]